MKESLLGILLIIDTTLNFDDNFGSIKPKKLIHGDSESCDTLR